MRKLVFLIILITRCVTFAGEDTALITRLHSDVRNQLVADVKVAVLDGYVFGNDDVAAYFRSIVTNSNFRDADHSVVVVQKTAGQEATISLGPNVVEKISHELQPYLTLHERGKNFAEELDVHERIKVSVHSGVRFSFSLTLLPENFTVSFSGDSAKIFIENFKNAEQDAKTWLFESVFRNLVRVLDETAPPTTSSSTSGTGQKSRAADVISLRNIAADYERNEYAANEKYGLNNRIRVSGTVEKVSRNALSKKPEITFAESIGLISISCYLADSVPASEIAQLKPGQVVVVEGIWQGKRSFRTTNIADAVIIK